MNRNEIDPYWNKWKNGTLRVVTPMHTPGPSNAEPRPIPQGPLKITGFEGPKTIETLRADSFSVSYLSMEIKDQTIGNS